jgi:pyridoxamine 5'-phosphate oxidase
MDASIASLRQDYKKATLLEGEASLNPFVQFNTWWKNCIDAAIYEPNAMSISTIRPDGFPDSRIVLLKDFNEKGFTFFTNYESNKGKAIAQNNKVHLLFFWEALERQVRIRGEVYKISEEESTQYFQSRPKSSQIGAWASHQSNMILDRSVLENEFERLTALYAEASQLPKPIFWGGYLVIPNAFEFWQGRSSRLHDRLSYQLLDGVWVRERLSP